LKQKRSEIKDCQGQLRENREQLGRINAAFTGLSDEAIGEEMYIQTLLSEERDAIAVFISRVDEALQEDIAFFDYYTNTLKAQNGDGAARPGGA